MTLSHPVEQHDLLAALLEQASAVELSDVLDSPHCMWTLSTSGPAFLTTTMAPWTPSWFSAKESSVIVRLLLRAWKDSLSTTSNMNWAHVTQRCCFRKQKDRFILNILKCTVRNQRRIGTSPVSLRHDQFYNRLWGFRGFWMLICTFPQVHLGGGASQSKIHGWPGTISPETTPHPPICFGWSLVAAAQGSVGELEWLPG